MKFNKSASRRTLTPAILLVSLLIANWSCDRKKNTTDQSVAFMLSDTMLNRISIDTVKIAPVANAITLVGKVVPDQNRVVDVFPLVGGNVKEVRVELGDFVKKDQVLAVIHSGEVAEFERQMIQANSSLLVAQKNRSSTQDMFESKLIPERDVIAAQKDVDNAQAELDRVKEIYGIYDVQKDSKYVVKSPINGFVIEKNINRDMHLRSDNAERLFTIGQISDVWVLANVNESDIPKINMGMQAQIRTISYPNEVFRGVVDKIYNVLDPETKAMQVRIKLENTNFKLKPEMHATVTLLYEEGINMASVPSESIIFDRSKNWVLVFKSKSNIEIRPVDVYSSHGEQSYIQRGLRPGEKVISKNQLLVYSALSN